MPRIPHIYLTFSPCFHDFLNIWNCFSITGLNVSYTTFSSRCDRDSTFSVVNNASRIRSLSACNHFFFVLGLFFSASRISLADCKDKSNLFWEIVSLVVTTVDWLSLTSPSWVAFPTSRSSSNELYFCSSNKDATLTWVFNIELSASVFIVSVDTSSMIRCTWPSSVFLSTSITDSGNQSEAVSAIESFIESALMSTSLLTFFDFVLHNFLSRFVLIFWNATSVPWIVKEPLDSFCQRTWSRGSSWSLLLFNLAMNLMSSGLDIDFESSHASLCSWKIVSGLPSLSRCIKDIHCPSV